VCALIKARKVNVLHHAYCPTDEKVYLSSVISIFWVLEVALRQISSNPVVELSKKGALFSLLDRFFTDNIA
jgi:hypothetical protein